MAAPNSQTSSSGLHSLEQKVRLGFAVAAIVLVLVGVFSYISVLQFRKNAALVDHTHEVQNSLTRFLTDLTAAESAQLRFVITAREEQRTAYTAATQQIERQLSHIRELTLDNPTQQMNLNALALLVTERLNLLQSRLDLRRTKGLEAVQSTMMGEQGRRVRDSIQQLVSIMENEENRLLQGRDKEAERSALVTRATIISGGVIALGLLFGALFLIRRDFERSSEIETDLRTAKNTLEDRIRERTSEAAESAAAVRAGEERLSRIIDSAMDAIITVDEQQVITMFNPAAERMFKCPVADAIARPLELFLPARFRASHTEHMRSFGKNSITRRTMGGFTPLSGLRTNGEEFPIEASISQVEIEGKKFFTAIVRDVTETAKAREISGRLAAIVESSDDAIISKTLDGIISSWNPAAEKLFGYPGFEVIGKPMMLIIPPENIDEETEILAHIAKGERIDHRETRRVRKDGKLIYVAVTISPLRDNSGRVVGASTIARDITEHKRIAEKIRQQANLLNLAPAVVRDMDDRIVLWTRGAEQLYGYTEEEAIGQTSHELLKTTFPDTLVEIQRFLNAEGVWEGELAHRARDGNEVIVASRWMLHRDVGGKPIRILEVNADISALKRAEALQMRSQKLEALGTLAGGIAHDFNNILSAINGSATLAISQFPPNHPVQACLTEIEKAGTRAADLVRRILTFSRPQDQNMQVQDLEPVIEEALKLVRATIPAMIEIRSEFAQDLPKARVDATQIYQVIVNLVTNAAHAIGDRHGIIEVKLDSRTVNEEEILLYSEMPPGDYIRLLVSDNGCGMDASTVQRIFDPFFSTKPTGKGTGLGLSVVHGIVTAHHGALKVYSEPGKGTTFFVYVPAVRDAVIPVSVPRWDVRSGHGERILFVDDEGVLLFVGTMSLEQNGYKVTGMPDGEAALRELLQNPAAYDAVLTDLSMPGMSGLQLAHQIRKLRPELPVILTSGYISPGDQAKADRLGIRAVLAKPVDTKQVLAALASLFDKNPRLNGA
ncbi:MAG: PAS domain S-box protein [Candidatus Acidiferrum sp.]